MASAGVAAEAALLLVGVAGNAGVTWAFLRGREGGVPLQVDRVVGLIALSGLAATLAALPSHLYAHVTGESAAVGSVCQLQGFLLNLLCLLSLWYTTVLALERYVKLFSAHEHALTFSLLNLNVVLSGVFVLLLIEVSGPIYGWAGYAYVTDLGICVLNPSSTHILTYVVVQTSCYVGVPAALTVAACAALLCKGHAAHPAGAAPPPRGSQVLKTAVGMRVLCLAMLLCVLFMLPYHVLLMLQAAEVHVPLWAKVASYWLKIMSLTCVYPTVLLLIRHREVWPPIMASFKGLRRCWFSEAAPTPTPTDARRRPGRRASIPSRSAKDSVSGL